MLHLWTRCNLEHTGVYSRKKQGFYAGAKSGGVRPIEQSKFDCDTKYFQALGEHVQFTKADSKERFFEIVSGRQ